MRSELTANEAMHMYATTRTPMKQARRNARPLKEARAFTRAHAIAIIGAVFVLMVSAALYL